jgi:hypothetical protein
MSPIPKITLAIDQRPTVAEKWRRRDAQKNEERLRVLRNREEALRSAIRRITGESS